MKKDFVFVGIQGVLFLVFLLEFDFFSFRLNEIIQRIGMASTIMGAGILLVAILQLNKNLSPFPTPLQNSELIKNGIYRFVRHPIYTGIILGSIGLGVYFESEWKITIGISLFILFHFKSTYEETLLKAKFEHYIDYMRTTGRFFPTLHH